MNRNNAPWMALQEAFPVTIPIFAGFWFVAFAYGFYMHTLGFSPLYPMAMAMIIFGGSLEFITVSLLLSPFAHGKPFSLHLRCRPAIYFMDYPC